MPPHILHPHTPQPIRTAAHTPQQQQQQQQPHLPTMPGTSLASAFSFLDLSFWLQAELVMSLVPIRITATLGCTGSRAGGWWGNAQ